VEYEQGGARHAEYGTVLVTQLATDLTRRFGRGFGKSNLYPMRGFYLTYCQILQTPSGKLEPTLPNELSRRFPLPWSHYVELLRVDQPQAREFYEAEALRNGWTARQLHRQITTLFYERTLASRNKAAMLRKGAEPRPEDLVTPEEEIKDPLLLEFLDLKDEYSESQLEEALIRHLESFLLELGGDFAFLGRQKRLRVGDTWFRIDLLFYHRRLRCLVIIDVKSGAFTYADAGQMHVYLTYAQEHWTQPDENPPVGLILCTRKDNALVHYALDTLPNKVLAAEYRTTLPDEGTLVAELERTRKMLEARRTTTREAGGE
jgi:predicted nuclease of restriction endonuclease-like (RecB) superfamily